MKSDAEICRLAAQEIDLVGHAKYELEDENGRVCLIGALSKVKWGTPEVWSVRSEAGVCGSTMLDPILGAMRQFIPNVCPDCQEIDCEDEAHYGYDNWDYCVEWNNLDDTPEEDVKKVLLKTADFLEFADAPS